MTIDYQTGEITEPLTPMEQSALVHAEAKIERGLTSFLEVGEALAEVRDGRLYRDEFGTFETYCRDRWNITDRRARQMINAATTVSALPTGTIVPVTESQARELRDLAPEQAASVMAEAHEATGGNVTAAAIRAARTPEPAIGGEAVTGSGQTPQGEAVAPSATEVEPESTTTGVGAPATPRPPVTGIDGKTYSRPAPKPTPAADPEYDNAAQACLGLTRAMSRLLTFEHPNMRAGMRAHWSLASAEVPPVQRQDVTPEQMRVAARGLLALADEWESK